MSTFTYLVTVEAERESGLNASRYDISEKITEEIERLADYVDATGLGARSDSDYSIEVSEVVELEKRDLKEVNAEYDRAVIAEEPSNKELRTELRNAKAEAEKYKALYETQKAIVDQIVESVSEGETRIYQDDRRAGDAGRVYLNDGQYDYVKFKFGTGDAHLSIRYDPYFSEALEVRYNGMGHEIFLVPRSSNEFQIRVDRRAL
jgi:hypothetical protein